MRIMMIVASVGSYLINEVIARARYANADRMNFEAPLTFLVWLTSLVSVALTFARQLPLDPQPRGDTSMWWKLSLIITAGTLAGAIIPEVVKVFTSTESPTCARWSRLHAREALAQRPFRAHGGQLQRVLDGHRHRFPDGDRLLGLHPGARPVDAGPAVFAFGLVAFGFLGMGPVTIAVDSYGPVTDNAQSVYELSIIEQLPGIQRSEARLRLRHLLRQGQALPRGERRGREHLQGPRRSRC